MWYGKCFTAPLFVEDTQEPEYGDEFLVDRRMYVIKLVKAERSFVRKKHARVKDTEQLQHPSA
jgi:hypothetical protein